MNPMNYVYLSAVLFSIGASGVLLRRNAIVVFMCVELMLNATNLAFVSFARMQGNLDGQVISDFERDRLHREVLRTQGQISTRSEYDRSGRLQRQFGDAVAW